MNYAPIQRQFAISTLLCSIVMGSMFGGVSENARLRASILPGSLEIETESVTLEHNVEDLEISEKEQVDAISFVVEGLVVNDLNGDGRGWRLIAEPQPLVLGESQLDIGTVRGFVNYPEIEGISSPSENELLSVLSEGISGFETDYEISYTIPAYAPVGTYQGKVYFTIAAE